ALHRIGSMILVPDRYISRAKISVKQPVKVSWTGTCHRELKNHGGIDILIRYDAPLRQATVKETIDLGDLVSERRRGADFRIQFHVTLKALHEIEPIAGFNTFRLAFQHHLKHIEAGKALVDFFDGCIVGRVWPQKRCAGIYVADASVESPPTRC